jgi:hypothetical protein
VASLPKAKVSSAKGGVQGRKIVNLYHLKYNIDSLLCSGFFYSSGYTIIFQQIFVECTKHGDEPKTLQLKKLIQTFDSSCLAPMRSSKVPHHYKMQEEL